MLQKSNAARMSPTASDLKPRRECQVLASAPRRCCGGAIRSPASGGQAQVKGDRY
ncbi:hypothetical protein PVAP13_1NG426776 [Panicum virgatum]|uniref:Uncharacterized protein n=1 Tax=Panicum virgatum TaxID=38727 RepID=A0A8T0X367_PANVG|nr:hypothetical protein PVAP13_1NG426776 [Panicum virgatum]